MAKIEKGSSSSDDKKEKSVSDLKTEFHETTEAIRAIINGKPDRNDLRDNDKTELRRLYTTAARIARTLSERVTDESEAEKYKDAYKKAAKKAESYGSAIKSTVPKTTMNDIAGLEHVKELVKSFLFMAQHSDLLERYHMEGGLGMLMYGAPGTGKTMFAEAVANAMNLPLFIVTPADIFKSYVGESEAAVKQIFEELDACESGAILFVDECESIFSTRKKDTKDYKSAVTTELLQRMNGFGVNGAKRIMIAATNRPDEIDPAYLRFKRFSHLVHVEPPDEDAIKAIISGKLKKEPALPISPDVSVEKIYALCKKYSAPKKSKDEEADATPAMGGDPLAMLAGQYHTPANADDFARRHYSAADICGIIEEACRLALVQCEHNGDGKVVDITMDMFESAFKKIPPSISASVLAEYQNFR